MAADATMRQAKLITADSDAPAFVVVDGDRPIGVITAIGVRSMPDSRSRKVTEAMEYEVVRVNPDDDVNTTCRAFHDAAWASVRRRRPFHGRRRTARRPGAVPASRRSPSRRD